MLRVLQEEAKRSFISATAISSMVACFLMGMLANMPLALAPGMVGERQQDGS
jgi:AGZA family xanthine/uracil permease-like MFS transporter